MENFFRLEAANQLLWLLSVFWQDCMAAPAKIQYIFLYMLIQCKGESIEINSMQSNGLKISSFKATFMSLDDCNKNLTGFTLCKIEKSLN